MVDRFDVAIVGARIAGSILASRLGDMGYRVLLVDAATFPSDTISTHFFRGAGLVSALRDLALLDEVLTLGAPPLRCQYVFSGTDATPAVEDPQQPGEVGYGLSVRRLSLDRILVERARRTPGVEVRLSTTVRDVARDSDDRVSGIVTEQHGDRFEIGARLVVGADGRGSLIARRVDAMPVRTEPATRAMYFRYMRGYAGADANGPGPEFSFQGDELVYAFPSDAGITCIAISVNLTSFERFRSGPEPAFTERVLAHPGIAPRFEQATAASRILASGPKDAIVRAASGPGWALVGDAALHQDPWTGLGMDNAAVHAGYLAEAIDTWLGGSVSEADALETYRRRRDDHAMDGFAFTATAGRDLSAA
jgi:flavin-dependent dehydrogenase